MKNFTIKGEIRKEKGRKVKRLRLAGFVPATVYGRNIVSQSISVAEKDFQKLYSLTGTTGLIDLVIDGTKKPVLVHTVQKHPVQDQVMHIEFHQVDLKQKVRTKVPIVLEGEPMAVTQKTGALLVITDEVEVEALPTDLPDKLTCDVTSLDSIGKEFRVNDLKSPKGVVILTEGSVTVAKIGAIVSREAEVQKAEEEKQAAQSAQPEAEEQAKGEGESTEADTAKKGSTKPSLDEKKGSDTNSN